MTQRRKCFSNLKQLFKSVTTLFPPTVSLLLFKCHQRDSGLLSFPRQLNFNNWSWVCWLVTAFLCLMWRSGLHVSLSGCSNRAWRGGGRFGWPSAWQQDKRWWKMDATAEKKVVQQQSECGKTLQEHFQDAAKTIQSERSQNLSDRLTCSHPTGRDLVYYRNELNFPPWNLIAGFSSEQIGSITTINSVICKKKKTERQEEAGGGCGKQPRALTGSHYRDLCVNSAPRLLKHCHPAISSVYLHNTTQRLTARLPTDSSCSTERPNNLRQNLSESSLIRIQTYSN